MEKLLTFLQSIPEYKLLMQSVQQGECAAVTGVGQINRSHLAAGIFRDCGRPVVLICQDDMSAKRLSQELSAFLKLTAPTLPGREMTFYDAAVVSRSWEQRRIQQLYNLASGQTKLQIFTWESLSQRTMPPKTLLSAAFSLKVGEEYSQERLLERLTASGYSRC